MVNASPLSLSLSASVIPLSPLLFFPDSPGVLSPPFQPACSEPWHILLFFSPPPSLLLRFHSSRLSGDLREAKENMTNLTAATTLRPPPFEKTPCWCLSVSVWVCIRLHLIPCYPCDAASAPYNSPDWHFIYHISTNVTHKECVVVISDCVSG